MPCSPLPPTHTVARSRSRRLVLRCSAFVHAVGFLTTIVLMGSTRHVAGQVPTDGPGHTPDRSGHPLRGRWTAAFEFGEVPVNGSFKLGVSLGYHVDEHVWLGVAYQIPDVIRRNGSSFNAGSVGLEGLTSSREAVGQRAYLQARIRPHRYVPYMSLGVVFNDRDTETITFDARPRSAAGHASSGGVTLTVSRAPAIRPALGLGYAWTSSGGLHAFMEWSGWWIRGAPNPEIEVHGDAVGDGFSAEVRQRLRRHFRSSLFNTYHVFQMGVGVTR